MVMVEGRILLNVLVESNLNSFCSPAEKYNISDGHRAFDNANYLPLPFICFGAALTGDSTE